MKFVCRNTVSPSLAYAESPNRPSIYLFQEEYGRKVAAFVSAVLTGVDLYPFGFVLAAVPVLAINTGLFFREKPHSLTAFSIFHWRESPPDYQSR